MDTRKELRCLSILLAGGILVGCSADDPVAPAGRSDVSLAGPEIVDISGTWNWSNVEKLTAPAFVAGMFGIPVEGPITRFRCRSSGTMTLSQVGNFFGGPVERTAISCVTAGGIVFVPPPAFSPSFFDLEDGTIRGKSIGFVFGGSPLPTPSHGVISNVEDGAATALRATGRTIVPGHPKSPLPQDPPPAGTSTMIRWEAVRS